MSTLSLQDYFDGGFEDAETDFDGGHVLAFPDTTWDITPEERAAYRRGYIKGARELEAGSFWFEVAVPEGFGGSLMTVYILTPEGVTKDTVFSATEAQTLAFLGQRKQHLVVHASGQAFNSYNPFPTYDERGI